MKSSLIAIDCRPFTVLVVSGGHPLLHNGTPIGRKWIPWRLCPHVIMIDRDQQLPSESSRKRLITECGQGAILGVQPPRPPRPQRFSTG